LNVSEVFQYLGAEFVSQGGEAALGTTGITSIEDVASKPMADRSAKAAQAGNASPSAPGEQPAAAPLQDSQSAFKLGGQSKTPSVRRTGGKKHYFSCDIL